MVAPAPTTWLDPFLEDWRPGTGDPLDDPRAGHRHPPPDDPRVDARRRRASGRRGGGRPARVGGDELPGAGPHPAPRGRHLRGAPRRVRRPGRSGRPAPSHGKMHHEQNFAYQETAERRDDAVPAVRLARADRAEGPSLDGPPRPGRRRRRDHPVELADRARACGSSAPALALGNAVVLKPDPQTPVVGGAMFAAVFAEAGLPDGLLQIVVGGADVGEALVTDPQRRRSCRSPGRRPRADGSASWRAACSRRSRWSSAGTTRSSCSTTPISTRPPPPARSRRSSSRARSASRPGGTSSTAASPAPTSTRSPRRRSASGWAIRTARTSSSGRSSTRSSSPASTTSSGDRSRAGHGSSRAARTRACSTARRC